LSEGNVIVAMTEQAPGLLGSSALIPEDNRYLHNQRLGLVDQVDPNTFDQLFLYYLFNTSKVRHQINASATGTKVRHTAPERIYRVRVRVPDVAVQRAIGRILQAYDDLIENNRRRMALLEEASRQLYKEWFVRLRFPGHEHCRLLNGLPEGWRTAHLSEITSKIGSGSTPRGGEASYQADGITLIRSLNVYDDRFNDDGLAFISESQAAALASVTVEPRDILLNITGASVARCCMAPERYLPARVNQHVMIIRVNPEKANPFFVHAAINSDERKRQLLSYSKKGSTREALTKEMMGGFEITLASDALTDQFSQFADKSFRQREIFALQNQKLKAARDLLLPRLMSGEIAV
jgi:type I restriction enzyme S subunit